MILFLGALVTCLGLTLVVSSEVAVPANVLPTPTECGVESSQIGHQGEVAGPRQSPWTCLVEKLDKHNKTQISCSCVLINQHYVLTTANCVQKRFGHGPSRIIIGEWDRNTEQDCFKGDCAPPVQKITVSKVVPHPQYRLPETDSSNDIALIRLETPVSYNDYVKPICLPLDKSLRAKEHVGDALELSGWGEKDPDKESYRKLTVSIDVVERSTCANAWGSFIVIYDSQICVGRDEEALLCYAETGGAPLIATDSSRPQNSKYLVGIASFGSVAGCEKSEPPVVFTKISAFMDWVQDSMES